MSTDASKTGVGGCLFQLLGHPVGTNAKDVGLEDWKIVMFMSARLTGPQTRWATTEREAFAALCALEETEWLTRGSPYPIMLYTDHQSLIPMLKGETIPDRIARWQIRFSQHFYDFVHVLGKQLAVADGLSRLSNASRHYKRTDDDELIALTLEPDPLAGVGKLNVLIEDD